MEAMICDQCGKTVAAGSELLQYWVGIYRPDVHVQLPAPDMVDPLEERFHHFCSADPCLIKWIEENKERLG